MRKEKKGYALAKRGIDVVVSIMGLLILSPFLFILSAIIWLEDQGPVLFFQERTGLNGTSFKIYKFRSMKVNHEKKKYTFENGVPDDFVFKKENEEDSHVTRVGKFIRRTSLDEFPQLFNVLQGTMSLVGPRPEIPEITNHYNEYQKRRLEKKPGVTGWAQVNGRSDMTNGQKIELDMVYIEQASALFDLKILWKTIGVVFSFKGAV